MGLSTNRSRVTHDICVSMELLAHADSSNSFVLNYAVRDIITYSSRLNYGFTIRHMTFDDALQIVHTFLIQRIPVLVVVHRPDQQPLADFPLTQ